MNWTVIKVLSACTTLFLLLIFCYLILSLDSKKQIEVMDMSATEEVVYWTEQIKSVGEQKAYAEFSTLYSEQSYGIQHTHAHIFGEALYKTKGIEGIATCDSKFGFGCFHSFFAWAMVTDGIGITQELDKACIAVYGEKGLGCPHGIGHGVLAELGTKRLSEALEVCAELNWKEPIGGCTSGVFMEYNQNTMSDGSLREPTGDWHYPCNVVAGKFAQACYFDQTTWWSGVTEEDFGFIGERCAEIDVLAYRETCFRGAGHTAATIYSFDFNDMRSACREMPDAESQLLCVEGATWLTSWEPAFKDTWKEMCSGYEDEYLKRCLDSVNFI